MFGKYSLAIIFCLLASPLASAGGNEDFDAAVLLEDAAKCYDQHNFECALQYFATAWLEARLTPQQQGEVRIGTIMASVYYSSNKFEENNYVLYSTYVRSGIDVARLEYPEGSYAELVLTERLLRKKYVEHECRDWDYYINRLLKVSKNFTDWGDLSYWPQEAVFSAKERVDLALMSGESCVSK